MVHVVEAHAADLAVAAVRDTEADASNLTGFAKASVDGAAAAVDG